MKKLALLWLILAAESSYAGIRLKELVAIEGVRDNQLVGYGLVVGLRGTGDRQQSIFSAQSLTNLLLRMGVSVSPTLIQVKNTAAVMVTATLPPYASPGSRIDATVAAIADCTSLQGGILVMTGLKAPDGQVYAVAQGPAVVSGFVAGTGSNGAQVNHPTVGRIPDGAIVERAGTGMKLGGTLRLQLRDADFTTAARVANVVNEKFGQIATAENAGIVSVGLPAQYQKTPTEFVSELERLTIDPDHRSRIVVNERTGTIIMGKDVHIAPVAIMQGNLTVEVQTQLNVSQPNALSSGGTTQVTPQVDVGVKEEKARDVILKDGATIEELVRALSVIGSTPRDIIAILQTLKSAGALEAELEVI
ncbi:MAG TPA: flagellar basal body P-ring protein FlgI [Bryobacteraceae bacterium]|nr:flagellar basal body P-ring protein FlgI [Bryobacteraceae bacterium]